MAGVVRAAQVATKAGVLNLPEWYDAGAYWIQNNPGTPFGEAPCCSAVGHALALNACRSMRRLSL